MEEQRIKNKSIKEIFLNILILLFIIILIISIGCIAKWFMDNKENKEISDKVSEAIIEINENKDEEIEYKVDFVKLKEINNRFENELLVNNEAVKELEIILNEEDKK
ncbi:MAG: hypothetical protein IKL08_02165, partial [Clostridia bacterium]|nr:hypothetical protein [Clostridia bacterium]